MTDIASSLQQHIDRVWDDEIVPTLFDYIAIPNVSKAFDPQWDEHGHMRRAVELVRDWCAARTIAGLSVDVHELPGLTPVIVIEVPAFGGGSDADTVLLYGHLDKQPEMTGWRDGLGPWTPVLEGPKLYGRGGADDGYAAFASVLAIEAAQAAGFAHHRCVVIIEASRGERDPDLPAHRAMSTASERRAWCCASTRASRPRATVGHHVTALAWAAGTLPSTSCAKGVHSGGARRCRRRSASQQAARPRRGRRHRRAERARTARRHPRRPSSAGRGHRCRVPRGCERAPLRTGAASDGDRTGRAAAVAHVATVAQLHRGGRDAVRWRRRTLLRPFTALQLSFRLPPTCDHGAALAAIERVLTTDPPRGHTCSSTGTVVPGGTHRACALVAGRARRGVDEVFGNPSRAMGEGGSIPFMGMLGEMFPDAQFVVTGVLGPDAKRTVRTSTCTSPAPARSPGCCRCCCRHTRSDDVSVGPDGRPDPAGDHRTGARAVHGVARGDRTAEPRRVHLVRAGQEGVRADERPPPRRPPRTLVRRSPGVMVELVEQEPTRFFRPPYVGVKGWLGVYLDVADVDWDELAEIVRDAYRAIAPAKLSAQLDG
ncbi:MAG: M20/M25/M40 family metallo-hydrolase [Ilumatobacteraceae bacterium]